MIRPEIYAIVQALICLLKTQLDTSNDPKVKEAREQYIKSTIKLLERVTNND